MKNVTLIYLFLIFLYKYLITKVIDVHCKKKKIKKHIEVKHKEHI